MICIDWISEESKLYKIKIILIVYINILDRFEYNKNNKIKVLR